MSVITRIEIKDPLDLEWSTDGASVCRQLRDPIHLACSSLSPTESRDNLVIPTAMQEESPGST